MESTTPQSSQNDKLDYIYKRITLNNNNNKNQYNDDDNNIETKGEEKIVLRDDIDNIIEENERKIISRKEIDISQLESIDTEAIIMRFFDMLKIYKVEKLESLIIDNNYFPCVKIGNIDDITIRISGNMTEEDIDKILKKGFPKETINMALEAIKLNPNAPSYKFTWISCENEDDYKSAQPAIINNKIVALSIPVPLNIDMELKHSLIGFLINRVISVLLDNFKKYNIIYYAWKFNGIIMSFYVSITK